MKIEHVALNVSDPPAMARWYVEHLGMRVVVGADEPPWAHFLAVSAGDVMLEIYRNEAAPVPDYAARHPQEMHVAFTSADPEADRDRLVAAGASVVEELRPRDGSVIIMLRDPWGLALQLCRRATPML